VITTDPHVDDLRAMLRQFYANVFVEYITKNPLLNDTEEMLHGELFVKEVDRYIKALNIFV